LWRIQAVQLSKFKWVRISTAAAFAGLMLVAFVVSWKRSEVWRNSQTLWQSVVAVAPNNLKAQLEVGSESLIAGDRPRAIAAFRRAHEIDASSEDAVINLGATLMQDRRYPEAAKLLEEAVRGHPDRAGLHLNLGLAYLGTDRPASGVNEIRRASELEPKNPEMRVNLALALSTSGDPGSAVREYRTALELNPKYAEAWNGLGAVLFKLGRNTEAKEAFQRALALRPHFPQALYNLRLLDVP
jgi:Flp pilus assembly protein TadD